MMDERAAEVIRHQEEMESARAVWEQHWEEIAERILPRQKHFTGKGTPGEKRTEKIFDSTGALALVKFAAAVDSLITPATQIWHRLDAGDERLEDNLEVKRYLEEVNQLLFKVRYRSFANFPHQAHECYLSLGAFGTLVMLIDDIPGLGIRYKSIPLHQAYIAEDFAGRVDYVHRKFEMSSRQLLQQFGDRVPEKVQKAAEKAPFQLWEVLHCVRPNQDIKPRARDYRSMAYSSYYVLRDGIAILSEGGYRSMPYAVSRHVTAPDETYGRSPAMLALPDIKMVNAMSRTILRASQKLVDPPLLLHEDGILSAFDVRPNALNYGGVNAEGRQMVIPLQTGGNIPLGLELENQRRSAINDSFFVTLFQILVESPNMTATEAMLRAQEKGQLLAPMMGRQQSEFIGPMIEREIDILAASRDLPPMPDVLREVGGEYKIEYTSPLARLRRAEDGTAILRTLESIMPLAQVDDSALDTFNIRELARELAEINGVPAKVLRSKEEVQALREQREQQAQMAQMLQGAQAGAGAAKDAAQAMQTAQAAGMMQ